MATLSGWARCTRRPLARGRAAQPAGGAGDAIRLEPTRIWHSAPQVISCWCFKGFLSRSKPHISLLTEDW